MKEEKTNLFLNEITFNKDYRTFKKDDTIKINKPLLILVGMNGSGKSTILDCLRDEFNIKDKSFYKKKTPDEIYSIKKSKENFETKYYDFHGDDKKYSGVFGDDIMSQVQSMSASSGIGSLIQFNGSNIKKSKNSLILLDEPDRGMAIKLQEQFSLMFLQMVVSNNNQLIVSTHSERIMLIGELIGQIYSVEHKRFFDTAKEFIEEHLK